MNNALEKLLLKLTIFFKSWCKMYGELYNSNMLLSRIKIREVTKRKENNINNILEYYNSPSFYQITYVFKPCQ